MRIAIWGNELTAWATAAALAIDGKLSVQEVQY